MPATMAATVCIVTALACTYVAAAPRRTVRIALEDSSAIYKLQCDYLPKALQSSDACLELRIFNAASIDTLTTAVTSATCLLHSQQQKAFFREEPVAHSRVRDEEGLNLLTSLSPEAELLNFLESRPGRVSAMCHETCVGRARLRTSSHPRSELLHRPGLASSNPVDRNFVNTALFELTSLGCDMKAPQTDRLVAVRSASAPTEEVMLPLLANMRLHIYFELDAAMDSKTERTYEDELQSSAPFQHKPSDVGSSTANPSSGNPPTGNGSATSLAALVSLSAAASKEIKEVNAAALFGILESTSTSSNWSVSQHTTELQHADTADSTSYLTSLGDSDLPPTLLGLTTSSSDEVGVRDTGSHAADLDDSNSDGAIAAGVITALIALAGAGIGAYFWYRMKYPVRMTVGRRFVTYSNPEYKVAAVSTLTLVKDEA